MASDLIDRPTTPRVGEELTTERLGPYLREGLGLDGELSILQYPSGYSNLTYQLSIGDTRIVLRRPPHGSKPASGHDMGREHAVLGALHGSFGYCPRPLLFCDDEEILGCPFYVMERVEGIIIRRDLPAGLGLEPAALRSLFDRVVDVHAELHALDYRRLGLEGFGRPEGYVERQIAGWSDRYRRAWTDDVPDFEAVMTWLVGNLPPESPRAAVIHNDFRLDNVVLDPSEPLRVVGVLDWEMATIGDPLMDLGASLAYWVEARDPPELHALRMMPTHLDGAPSRREVVAHYGEVAGIPVEDFGFYLCYGLFRLAVISQQIYYRFVHGQTQDERFASLGMAVRVLEGAAGRVIAGGGW